MWAKISDDFFRNPKVVKAGRDARDLYLVGLCHCNEHLTDGFIDASYLRRLAADAEIDSAKEAASKLVEVGLWHETDGGYEVNDFEDHNISKAEVEAKAKAKAERQERWLKSRGASKDASRDASKAHVPGPGPVPEPVYVPSEQVVVGTHGCREAQTATPPPMSKTQEVEQVLSQADQRPDRAHWRAELTARMAEKGWAVGSRPAYALTVLKGWLAGDGAPPIPGTESPPPPRGERRTRHQRETDEALTAIRRNGKARRDALAQQWEAEDAAAGIGTPGTVLKVMEGYAA